MFVIKMIVIVLDWVWQQTRRVCDSYLCKGQNKRKTYSDRSKWCRSDKKYE